jgi:hypothetical protein
MAYSKTPSTSTYQTKPLPFANELFNRTGDPGKDVDMLNCFVETQGSKVSDDKQKPVYKRAGLENYITTATDNVRGYHYWEDEDRLLVATDNDVTIYNSSTGVAVATLSNIFGTTTGDVGFSEFLYDTNEVRVVITDGTTLGTVTTGNVWAPGADPDMPVPHLPQPVFLDGYLFLVKADTADIYNSDLNDPLAYTTGNFISCEMFPDTVLRFAKLNNYLIAFGSASMEYFWDAANESGSPLQRNDTPVKLVGYLGGYAQSGNQLFFVGNTATSTPDVYLVEDFKLTPVGSETVRKYLESLTDTTETTLGNIVSFMGHDFFVLTVSETTYVYDLKVKNWVRWAWQQETNFPLQYAVSIKANTTFTTLGYISGSGVLSKFGANIYSDNGVLFTTTVMTDNQFFDSYNQKTMHRISVVADRPTSTALLKVSWSDDDYQTFNTPFDINLNQELPSLTRLGNFRRRAFKFTFTSNHPLRLFNMEVDINLGQN